jgi:chromatin remodeling complex protein RSC6
MFNIHISSEKIMNRRTKHAEEVHRYYEITERLQTRNYFNSLSGTNQMTSFGQKSPVDREALRRKIKTELPALEKRFEEEKTKEKEKERAKEEREKEESRKRFEDEAKKRLEDDAKIHRYRVSDELAMFLGRPFGTKMLQKEAVREIEQYAVANKLVKKCYGNLYREIVLDSKLASLLKLKRFTELSEKKFLDAILSSPHFAEERRARVKERERKEFEERLKKEEKEKRYQEFKSKRMANSNIAEEIVNYVPFYPLVVATSI